ncbi:DUF4402 domain-containing protein [Ferrimonas lipolytica]|uniref:DUF4402 domain-containing protein n=1 Tax=Ferrimonas lipolytica TaxID=2724191 RepID=A0A6H1UEH0_9GAMM|nr:DUF4402 domain-containing protein [Ferrimonas lipolytica]QIZ77481.1 DUF4402 domain-containing protein [Ferrimonas lipolytica]
MTIQHLNFGEVVNSDVSQVSTVTVHPDGHTSSTKALWRITPGQLGLYQLIGLPPYTVMSISSTITVPDSTGPNNNSFKLTEIVTPTTLTADIYGEAQLEVSGTLETVKGKPAFDGIHSTYFHITVSY